MFLTRAFEIINKEGFLTFKYALGQKMRENMTDEKIYQLYIKNVEPRQNAISENQCVQVVSVKENNTVKQVMEAAEKVSTEYVVLCSADYELCENYEKKVSHYILIQKKLAEICNTFIAIQILLMTMENGKIQIVNLIIHGTHCFHSIILAMCLL